MAEENKVNGLAWFLAGLGVGARRGSYTPPRAAARPGKN